MSDLFSLSVEQLNELVLNRKGIRDWRLWKMIVEQPKDTVLGIQDCTVQERSLYRQAVTNCTVGFPVQGIEEDRRTGKIQRFVIRMFAASDQI